MKEARKRARENERRYREEAAKRKELEARLAAAQRATAPAEEAPTLGPEPKLEDHDWDADRFKAALLDWADKKRKVEEHSAKQRAAIEAEAKAWPGLEGMDLALEVTCRQTYGWDQTRWQFGKGYGTQDKPTHHVVAIDYGAKRNILRCLASAGCKVTVVPATATAADVLRHKQIGRAHV